MDENCRALLEKSDVTEEQVMDCLYGENIDKFRELVTLVAVQNNKSEEDVKLILSNNRRRVKNRGSARRSRVSKNDHLQNLRDEQARLKKKLNRVLHLSRVNQVSYNYIQIKILDNFKWYLKCFTTYFTFNSRK